MTGRDGSQRPAKKKGAGVSIGWSAAAVTLLLVVFSITGFIAPGFLISGDSGNQAGDGGSGAATKSTGGNGNRQTAADAFARQFVRSINDGEQSRASNMICDGYLYARNTVAEAIDVDANVAIEGRPAENGGRGTIHDVNFAIRDGNGSSQLMIELGQGTDSDRFCVYRSFFMTEPSAAPSIEATKNFANEMAEHIGHQDSAAVEESLCPYQPPSDQGPVAELIDSVLVRGGSGIPKIADVERNPGSSGSSVRQVDLKSATGEVIELDVMRSISGDPCIAKLDV